MYTYSMSKISDYLFTAINLLYKKINNDYINNIKFTI